MPKLSPFKPITAIGLMSGTSKDGVDVVRLQTDGEAQIKHVQHYAKPYPRGLYARLKELATADIPLNEVLQLERDVSEEYVLAVLESGFLDEKVKIVGCHGQTVRHLPHQGLTWQLGDPNYLAEKLSQHSGRQVPVVMDFRRRDLAAGGEGAPLAPLFHRTIILNQASKQKFPSAFLNIGGVANISFVAGPDINATFATDCGPGMGLLDQFVQHRTGAPYDIDGVLALSGKVQTEIIKKAQSVLPFFNRPIPRSADRYEFNAVLEWLEDFSDADGAATLSALTVAGIDQSLSGLRATPDTLQSLYIAGGGQRNRAIWQGLKTLGWPIISTEDSLQWSTFSLEAACWAWLAVRRLRGLPFSVPTTTGCRHATVGGTITFG
jgi:anhydro-N-acetylmuramic acid kinase